MYFGILRRQAITQKQIYSSFYLLFVERKNIMIFKLFLLISVFHVLFLKYVCFVQVKRLEALSINNTLDSIILGFKVLKHSTHGY